MPRQCQRPDCFEPASVAYSFDASRQLVVLDALADDDRSGSVLCARHAQAMVLPKGWWLDDQRVSTPTLFTAGKAAALEATSTSVSHRPRRRKDNAPAVDEPSLPMAAPAPEPAAAVIDEAVEAPAVVSVAPMVPVAEAVAVESGSAEAAPAEAARAEAAPAVAVGDEAADEATGEPEDEPVPAWTPNFDDVEDLGLLQVNSPLLSRAFGAKGSQGARRRRTK